MRHAGTQEIETPRLLLRRLMPSDAPMMYANWANDPEVTRWLRWTPHKDVALKGKSNRTLCKPEKGAALSLAGSTFAKHFLIPPPESV